MTDDDEKAEKDQASALPVVCAASLAGNPAPPRPWHVPEVIPRRQVTLLGGDGGNGKSTIALQLGVATAAGKGWLGMSPARGPAIYLSAEDDIDELNRRLEAVGESYGIGIADLPDLHFVPLAGLDAVLAGPGAKPGIIAATALWHNLRALVEKRRPRLVCLDTLADVFAGNENARQEVRQFVGLLRGLAIEFDLAVLLLAHPSLAGMASGSGTSGSTAWNNSVRSRLYLDTVKDDGGREIDADLRVLSVRKANYGRRGLELRIRWFNGCFVLDGAAEEGQDQLAVEAKAERVFLDLLAALSGQGRDVSPNRSQTYAPVIFAKHPSANGLRKEAFERAMERLLAADRIRVETSGPPSRRYKRLVFAAPKEAA